MPGLITGLLIAGEFCLLIALELRRPLRRSVEPKFERVARNLAFSASSAVAVRLAEFPLVQPLSRSVERRKLGFLQRISMPRSVEIALAILLMDYTLYIWHRLMHRSSRIWRYHLPHHVDLDLDASTALRFHFSELVLSVPWRAAQILFIGVSPAALASWQNALMCSILFHHSNVRLPLALEKRLCRVVMTPRLHGIHHSAVRAEEESNFSSGLTFWDALHGTLKLDVPQDEITIGVPAYRDPRELGLIDILVMPFRRQRPTWQLSENREPIRVRIAAPRSDLLP